MQVSSIQAKTMPLTTENVEKVLDQLRPHLRADGGDVSLVEIDGPIVKLQLQGSCLSCSSSSVTMKHGIEKSLMEAIPGKSFSVSPLNWSQCGGQYRYYESFKCFS